MARQKASEVRKLSGLSADVAMEKLEALRKLVPEAFSEGKLDPEKLANLFNKNALTNNNEGERYRIEWVGKSLVYPEIAKRTSCTLTPDLKRSINFENSQNIFIEGENLEVLRILQKAYFNKVKMIYIDPPYNTGKDFVYNDNFRQTETEYCENSCNVGENGLLKRALKLNTKDSGRFHSNWLSMMYPRLFLARNLLKDDGVIFVSIDDNEVHNLRMIMNEIFGEENFVGEFIRQSKVGGGSDTKYVVKEHEYCLVFAKNVFSLPEFYVEYDSEYLKRYKEEDEIGKYFWDTLARGGLKNPIRFEVTAPDGTKLTDNWNRSEKTFYADLKSGDIKFKKTKTNEWNVYFKQRLNVEGKKPRSLTSILGSTIDGKNDINLLFNDDKIFSYPKPVKLIKFLSSIVTNESDIILDFFSGSGTTAHAVMKQNAEDGGNRKYICVQMPEETPEGSEARKAGYKKISDIAIERIKRAAKKIKEENPSFAGDLGVRVYRQSDSNFPVWHTQSFENGERLAETLMEFAKHTSTGDEMACATEVLLKIGHDLNTPIVAKNGFLVADGSIALVLKDTFKVSELKHVLEVKPRMVIILEKVFKNDSDKINFALRCKEAKIIFQTI